MKSTLFAIATLAVATLAPSAYADSTFTATPGFFGAPQPSFQANSVDGTASSLLTLNANNTVNGSGYVDFTTFNFNGQPIAQNSPFSSVTSSGLGAFYDLWTTFSYTTALKSVTASGDRVYDVTSLMFDVYGKALDGTAGSANKYNQAMVGATSTPATVTNGTGIIYKLGTGQFDPTGPNSATIAGGSGGTSFNARSTFSLTADGMKFFTSPVPFFDRAFDSFTNTSTGFKVSADGKQIALTNAVGGVDFAVPEPSSIALLGLGLLALGVTTARRRKS